MTPALEHPHHVGAGGLRLHQEVTEEYAAAGRFPVGTAIKPCVRPASYSPCRRVGTTVPPRVLALGGRCTGCYRFPLSKIVGHPGPHPKPGTIQKQSWMPVSRNRRTVGGDLHRQQPRFPGAGTDGLCLGIASPNISTLRRPSLPTSWCFGTTQRLGGTGSSEPVDFKSKPC